MFRTKKAFVIIAVLGLTALLYAGCRSSKGKQGGLIYFNDFEEIKGWVKDLNLAKMPAHSGVFSNKLDTAHQYGQTLRLRLREVDPSPLRKVKGTFWCYVKNLNAKGKIAISIDGSDGKNILWTSKEIMDFVKVPNKWTEINIEWGINHAPGLNNVNNMISIFPWNQGKEEIFVDDINVEFVK